MYYIYKWYNLLPYTHSMSLITMEINEIISYHNRIAYT